MKVHERLKQLREEKNKLSQKEIANLLKISQSAYSQIENGSVSLSMSHLQALSAFYEVTTDYITKGRKPKKTSDITQHNIPLVNVEARAGYVKNYSDQSFLQELECYKIPGFDRGDFRVFEVEGDSMQPTLAPNDYIVCQEIGDVRNFVEGSICVVVSEDAVVVKRLYENGDGKSLVCKSDNGQFKPFKMAYTDINQLWAVGGKITTLLSLGVVGVEERLSGVEKELAAFKETMTKLLGGKTMAEISES